MQILIFLTIIIGLVVLILGCINLGFQMYEGFYLIKEIHELLKYFFNKKKLQ
jgi:hypothetical protein